MNTRQTAHLSHKRWLSIGAGSLLMASMLFFVQIRPEGKASSAGPVLVKKTSYVSNPDFPKKQFIAPTVNPDLIEFISAGKKSRLEKPTPSAQREVKDLYQMMGQMEDLQMKMNIHQSDPQYDPTLANRKMEKLRERVKEMTGNQAIDQLFDTADQATH